MLTTAYALIVVYAFIVLFGIGTLALWIFSPKPSNPAEIRPVDEGKP